MNRKQIRPFRRRPSLQQAVTIVLLVTLLAGLIPPPLARSVLPAPAAALVEAALPQPAVAYAAAGSITVNVYEDFNANGSKDAAFGQTDVGLQGISATAYCADGTSVAATTNASGVATLSHTCPDPTSPLDPAQAHVRVEVTWDSALAPFAGLYPAPQASSGTQANGSTVQFVRSGNQTVNVGLLRPADYVGPDPALVASAQWGGSYNNDIGSQPALYKSDWAATATSATVLDAKSNTGSIWGVAYSRLRTTIFTAASVKRHAGLGSGGIGAIYRTPVNGGASALVTSVSGVGSIPDDATRGLGDEIVTQADQEVFTKVGKAGIGDLDISDDETTLWYTNLFDRQLYRLPIGAPPAVTPGAPTSVGMGSATCTNGTLRPWAVAVYGEQVFVGAVCDAGSDTPVAGTANSNLTAHVFAYNPTSNSWTTILSPIALDQPRGSVGGGSGPSQLWYPWTDSYVDVELSSSTNWAYPQPILADLAFDVNGVLLLGIKDRHGDQSGTDNLRPDGGVDEETGWAAGTVLKACWSFSTNQFVLESNGICGAVGDVNRTTNGNGATSNSQGPGGDEFFYQDYDSPSGGRDETGSAGLAVLAGSGQIATTAQDVGGVENHGIEWYNQSDGANPRARQLYSTCSGSFCRGNFYKADGLGDLELLGNPPPLEIGNRVWTDVNGNGIQDPGEAPLAGVLVELYQGGVKIGEATTDSKGEYYFGGANSRNLLMSPTLNTITRTVSASSDDAAETVSGGAVNLANGALNLPYNGTALNLIGLRFSGVTIPDNATINSAVIGFTANGNASTAVDLTIRGEAADNAATFANSANNLSSRTTTSAGVTWAPGAWTTGQTTNATTPDLQSIVQEVVDRAGWINGNSLTFRISDNGTASSSNRRVARSVDNSNGGPPVLTVTYYAPYAIQPGAAYEIRIPNASGGSQQAVLSGLSLTTQNANSITSNDPLLDLRDSDGAASGVNASITYTTGSAGQNNHTLDFGFTPPQATGTIQVVKNTVGSDETFTFSSPDSQLDAVSITTVGNTGNSGTPLTKNAGVYTITEDALTGWSLIGITITGESNANSAVNTGDRQAVVQLETGETITVTFINSATTVLPCALHPVINQVNAVATTSNNSVLGPLNDQATVQLNPCVYDYGDLPDSSTSSPSGLATTSPSYNTDITGTVGASHLIIDGLYLGSLVDDETGGQPDSDALGDDNAGTPDDEEGVTFPTFTAGQSAVIAVSVVNTTGNAAVLYGFIDWNGDGTFDDADEVATQTVNVSGAVNLTVNVPANTDTTQRLGARFRLSTQTGLGPDGSADDGEVEDYLISLQGLVSLGNLVWRDTNNNGLYEPGSGESGIDNVVVELRTLAGTLVATDTTSSGGYYLFPDLTPGAYRVTVAGSNFAIGQPLFGLVSSTDPVSAANINADTNDDDDGPGMVNAAVTSAAITLTVGGEPITDGDSDTNSNLTVDFGFYAPRSELQLTKTLASAGVVNVGERVIYDLRIENSGEITATELTLVDQYDQAALTYVTATLVPDLQSSGLLTWTGTTAAGSFQPYLPLAPGGAFTVTVEFTAMRQ